MTFIPTRYDEMPFWHVQICLRQDEYLTSVKGHYGLFNSGSSLDHSLLSAIVALSVHTGRRKGAPFKLPACGGKIIGFHGRSDSLLDAFGTYVKMG
jgi:hypothetical protein